MTANEARQAAHEHIAHRGQEILKDFLGLLAIPNVTGHVDQLRLNADELAARFRHRGADIEVVELEDAGPVVVGSLRCGNPTATVGVYVHYDGQPVDPGNWTTPPFQPTVASAPWHAGGIPVAQASPNPEWRIYARGASDDKAPFAALCSAMDALASAGLERQVDLVFLFEGEEESGSPNLGRYMEAFSDRLEADVWLLCDGPVHQSRRPQVAFGARGYCGFELTVYGPERELHSGHYGNHVPNPALELAQLLASCKDAAGTVVIPRFYDDTWPITDADRAAMRALPDVEDALRDELGFGGAETDEPYPERLMIPSFNVRGLDSAAVGQGARNVIPADATASVDIRLAAGDDPQRTLERVQAHFENQGYIVLDREPTPQERRLQRRLCRMTKDTGYRAARIPMDSALAEALLNVTRAAAEEDPVALPTFGGSVPLYLFEDLLGAPVAILPIANHDNNQHAPDENLRLGNLWYGVAMWSVLLTTDFGEIGSIRR